MTDRRMSFLIMLLVGSTLAMAALLRGLWQPIFWAVVLGILFRPVQQRLTRRFGGRTTPAAGLIVVLVFLFLIVPAILLAGLVFEEASQLVERVNSGDIDPGATIRWFQGYLPRIEQVVQRLGLELEDLADRLRDVAARAGEYTLSLAIGAGQNAAGVLLGFFLALYLMFFILRDGDRIYRRIFDAIPLQADQKSRFFNEFAIVSKATLKGTVVIGLVQGTLGGIIFALLGIEGSVFWGAVMAVASILPALGATLIWLPAAIILVASGAFAKGLILVAFGTLVISMSDNALRPVLVGRDTSMPDYLVLFSTLGGLSLFGITGVVLGPVIAAFFLVAWQIFSDSDG
jgi:predicted PurR-regulated permease PerM